MLPIEPDLALNYEQLGNLYWLLQNDAGAETSYRDALQRNPRLVDSRLGLAKIYQRKQKYPAALSELDAAEKVDPLRPDIHYMRGQVLLHMDRKSEAKKEMEAATRIDSEHRSDAERQAEAVPSPELLQDQ
jgi:tetratricopeptide (TPR) repeat protein